MQTRERVAWSLVCLLLVCAGFAGYLAVRTQLSAERSAQLARERLEFELARHHELLQQAERDRIAQQPASTGKKLPEQAVLIHLKLSNQKFGTRDEMDAIHALSHKLEELIKARHLGEFDGDEFGQGECTLYMYGPNADALFAGIEPLLRASSLTKAGWATKRYGDAADPKTKEVKVPF